MRPKTRKMMNAECGMMNERLHGPRNSSFIIHHSSFRGAFSLLELMIAIMILGIGLVMVATVFPIGIDMAAENVKMNIAQAVADTATGVLQTKLPTFADRAALANNADLRFVPDVEGTDLFAVVNAPSFDVLDSLLRPNPAKLFPYPFYGNGAVFGNLDWRTWAGVISGFDPQVVADCFGFIDPGNNDWRVRARVFTDRSGWDADLPERPIGYTSIVWHQNLPANYNHLLTLPTVDHLSAGLPTPPPPSLSARLDYPAISLLDQVYPPVPRTMVDPMDPNGIRIVDRPVRSVLGDLANRRYSWLAVHHVVSNEPGVRTFANSIIVTHRADLNRSFVRQTIQNANGVPNLDERKFPEIDPTAKDMLFPQPWLVRLQFIHPQMGTVKYYLKNNKSRVPELFPPGSSLVVAYTKNGLQAGLTFEILGPPLPRPTGSNNNPMLQIRRGVGDQVLDVDVWVVPPSYDRATGKFGTKSPVVGTSLRTVSVR